MGGLGEVLGGSWDVPGSWDGLGRALRPKVLKTSKRSLLFCVQYFVSCLQLFSAMFFVLLFVPPVLSCLFKCFLACVISYPMKKRGGEEKNKTQKEQEKQERGKSDLAFSIVITNQNACPTFFGNVGVPVQSDFSGLKYPEVCSPR